MPDTATSPTLTPGAPSFDHFDPQLLGPAFWEALHELAERGPLTWVASYGGYWAATSYDTVRLMAQDWETFSSAQGVSITRPSPADMPYVMPIDIDPPRQRVYRREINPHLTIKALDALEGPVREVAGELIEVFASRFSCDMAVEFTRKLPGTVLFRLLLRCADADVREVEPWVRMLSFEPDPAKAAEGAGHLRAWAGRTLADRGESDSVDIVAAIKNLRQTGEPFADHELSSGLQILISGGMGTSANATSTIVRVLAEDQALQRRVRADMSLIPALVEECLRFEPPTPLLFRTASADAEVAGQQIRAGDKIGLFYGSANRDPLVFDHPDEIDIDRPHNRHLSFGAGPHRCIGSHLARLTLRVAVRELLTRLGTFQIPAGAELRYLAGQTRGLTSLPLIFEPPLGGI